MENGSVGFVLTPAIKWLEYYSDLKAECARRYQQVWELFETNQMDFVSEKAEVDQLYQEVLLLEKQLYPNVEDLADYPMD